MLDEDTQATPYFSSYLSIYPNAELDDIVFSPEIVSFFNNIKEDFLMLPNGSIKFESYPSGALVFLNGKVVGVTPTVVRGITEGRHFYRIHKSGYRDRGDTIQVKERRTASVSEDLSKYEKTSYIEDAEKEMTKSFGSLSMLRKAVDVAKEMKVDYILVTLITADAGRIKYEGKLVNAENRTFKEATANFEIFDKKDLASIAELQDFNSKLIDDTKGFRPISDVALDEANILGIDETKKDDKKKKNSKPVYKQWWLWTILGVVVLGGAGVGTYFLVKDLDKNNGATLEVNF
jgi:TolB-like protein